MVTKNSINSNIPIEISKGGTNSTSFANNYGTAYLNSTKLDVTNTGTTGMPLVSRGGTGPIYKDLYGITLVSTQTANNSARIDFLNLGADTNYMLLMSNVKPANNAAYFELLSSIDNGGTFPTSGYAAMYFFFPYNSNAQAGGLATYALTLGEKLSNTAYLSGIVNLLGMNNSPKYPAIFGQSSWVSTVSGQSFGQFGGMDYAGTNAIRLVMDTGNISTGTFSLYKVSV